jgi:hypothetical protein
MMRHILPCLALGFAASALAAQQQLVLPDNHYLMESATQLGCTGSTAYWTATTGSRFQILYEASHFTGKAGVTGPIVLSKIRFRGEDGEPNLGGQVYANAIISVGSTSLTAATMTNTYATNVAAATSTMSAPITTNVTVAPSLGSVPNNYCIEIDVLTQAVVFDPLSTQPNLLIDVTLPTAPSNAAPLALIPIQDTVATGAGVRGRGLTSSNPAAVTGALSATPPVVGLEFLGAGGFANPTPARNERYGAGCGGAASSFYETFQNGQAFDLVGLTLTPDNPTAPSFYIVSNGAQPFDATKINATANSSTDDALVTHQLGFTFAYPGGTTTTIKPSTNGFVWLSATPTGSPFTTLTADFLGSTTTNLARFCLYWTDLNGLRNTPVQPLAGLHVLTDTSGGAGNAVCYVTWFDTGLFRTVSGTGVGGHALLRFQCVLHEATGVVEFRYWSMPPFVASSSTTANTHGVLVGFSRGRIGTAPSVDPQSRDLSLETPLVTAIEGTAGNMGQTCTTTPDAGGASYGGRIFGGQTATYGAVNVPAGSLLAAQLFDVVPVRPGVQLPGIVAPGCMLSVSAGAYLWELFLTPGSTITGTVPVTFPHGLEGIDLYSQVVVLGGLFGGPDLITASSSALKQTIGLD